MVTLAEHADVVVDIAGDRPAVLPAERAGVEAGRDVELPALLPQRVVVVGAVEAVRVVPQGPLGQVGVLLGDPSHGPRLTRHRARSSGVSAYQSATGPSEPDSRRRNDGPPRFTPSSLR